MKLTRYTVRRTVTEEVSFDSTLEGEELVLARAQKLFDGPQSNGMSESLEIVLAEEVERIDISDEVA